LSSVQLSGVQSVGLIGTPASLPDRWTIEEGYLVGPDADLRGAKLQAADLSELDLSAASLQGANLHGAFLENCNLSGAKLEGVISGYIYGEPAGLPEGWSVINGFLIGPFVDLSNSNFENIDFSDRDLSGVKFTDSILDRANFTGSNLTGAIFSECDLYGTVFFKANLTDAQFIEATGSEVWFTGATIENCDFEGSFMSFVRSGQLKGSPLNGWHWIVVDGFFVGRSTIIEEADLSGVDFGDLSLEGAIIDGANLTGADLSRVNLAGVCISGIIGEPSKLPGGWRILNGWLVGPGADLFDADLTNQDLSGMDLEGTEFGTARLHGANIDECDFSAALLDGVESGELRGTPAALPAGWSLIDGTLVKAGSS